MTCRELAEVLLDYVAGDLPDDIRARIKEHMDSCPPCIHYVETYRLTIQLTRRLPPAEPPPALIERLKAALEAERGE